MPELTPGSNTCLCTLCGEYFNSPTAFDKHLLDLDKPQPRCLTVAQMEAKGMSKNKRGCWITAARPKELRREVA